MHGDEIETDESLVRRLFSGQFPQWAGLPIEALPAGRTDNAIYRLGDELSVRLPRRRQATTRVFGREFEWLPKLAPYRPLAVPSPGRPRRSRRGVSARGGGLRLGRRRRRGERAARPASRRGRPREFLAALRRIDL
jgi:aminoglycoside phosphotransferase (APT) family kinase protein